MCLKLISILKFFHLDFAEIVLLNIATDTKYKCLHCVESLGMRTEAFGIKLDNFVMLKNFTTSETAVKPFAVTKWFCPCHNHYQDYYIVISCATIIYGMERHVLFAYVHVTMHRINCPPHPAIC